MLDNIRFRYGDLTIVDGVSLEVDPGGLLVVTGENGIGKSTFLYLCAGLIPLDSGRVLFNGHAADPLHPSRLMHEGVRRGFIFQHGGLISNLTSLANVRLPLEYHADILDLTEAEIEQRSRAALNRARVFPPDTHATPSHLSFGERKRVALARALALNANFVYFDDPDAGLDDTNAELIDRILIELRDDPEVTVVVATTSKDLMKRLECPVYELVGGELVERNMLKPARLPKDLMPKSRRAG